MKNRKPAQSLSKRKPAPFNYECDEQPLKCGQTGNHTHTLDLLKARIWEKDLLMRKTGRLSKTRANDLKPERSFLEKLSPDQTRALVPENKPWPQSERWSALTTSTQLWSLFAGFDVHSSWGTRSELLTLQWHRAQRKTRPSLCAAAANLTLLYSLMKMKSYLYITIQNTIQFNTLTIQNTVGSIGICAFHASRSVTNIK